VYRGRMLSLILTKRFISVLARTWAIACAVVPPLFAQGGGNIPVIRTEAREVLVPTIIDAEYNHYSVLRLSAADFRLFEDGREQKIRKVTLERAYFRVFQDNVGVQQDWAFTTTGKWTRFTDGLSAAGSSLYYYIVTYEPPPSP
jgi:hypothetical protein